MGVATVTGGGNQGGAIHNEGPTATLTAVDSFFLSNEALGTGTGNALGGAIADDPGSTFQHPSSTTTLTLCQFIGNSAVGGSSNDPSFPNGAHGGAIAEVNDAGHGTLNVNGCLFQGNQANSGGGYSASGGAIDSEIGYTVGIVGSNFVANSAVGTATFGADAWGGAVSNLAAMTIRQSQFTGNTAHGGANSQGVVTSGQAFGGAVANAPVPFGFPVPNPIPQLTISDCQLSGNQAVGGDNGAGGAANGGAIANNSGSMTVTHCTIADNRAVGGADATGPASYAAGGGVSNFSTGGGVTAYLATMSMDGCTLSGNVAQGGAGSAGQAGGSGLGGGVNSMAGTPFASGSTLTITNCAVMGNQALGGAGGAGAKGGDGAGGGIGSGDFALTGLGTSDNSVLTVTNCSIDSNLAQGGAGGTGANGGDGLGGGAYVGGGTATIDPTDIRFNNAQGGKAGNGVVGGLYIDVSASVTLSKQTVVAQNHASTSHDNIFGNYTLV
jgi:hypothetical protein